MLQVWLTSRLQFPLGPTRLFWYLILCLVSTDNALQTQSEVLKTGKRKEIGWRDTPNLKATIIFTNVENIFFCLEIIDENELRNKRVSMGLMERFAFYEESKVWNDDNEPLPSLPYILTYLSPSHYDSSRAVTSYQHVIWTYFHFISVLYVFLNDRYVGIF